MKDKVKIKFIDIIGDNIENYVEALNLLRRGHSIPLVMINGKVKFQGDIPYKAIYNELEKYLYN
jgi:disulfide oxidoreductase YuzD